MIKLGNVIANEPLVNHEKVDYINYIDGSSEIDESLPSLYVGWSFFKSIKKTNFETILDKEYDRYKIYWEYSFNENKSEHVNGTQLFTINAPYYYFWNRYEYVNIDPVFNKIESLRDLLVQIPKFDKTYVYKNEMVYGLSGKKIYGMNIKMFEYFNIDIAVFIENIGEYSNHHIDDNMGLKYQKYYKILPNFNDLKRYIVILL